MRLAAYAQIRNEADIAAVFLRHLRALYDHVLLIDHGSSDGTSDVLIEACRVFPGWECWRCDIAGHHQGAFAKFAIDHLFATTDASIVMIHDADEFLAVADRDDLQQRLGVLDHPRTVGLLKWLNCVPGRFSPATDFDPAAGFWRPAHGSNVGKVVLSRRLMEETGGQAAPTMGNHDVEPMDGKPFEFRPVADLLHFPIRSASQISQKAAIGTIANLLRADRLERDNFHWRDIVGRVADGSMDDADLIGLAACYGMDDAIQTPLGFDALPAQGFTWQHSGIALADRFRTDKPGTLPDAWRIVCAALREPQQAHRDALDLYVDSGRLLSRPAP